MVLTLDFDTLHAQDYLDESGWTSLEPEGAGHHPHAIEWHTYMGGESGLRTGDSWEDRYYSDFEGPEVPPRGKLPVEGDGFGGPE